MRNENRAVFDRASEHDGFVLAISTRVEPAAEQDASIETKSGMLLWASRVARKLSSAMRARRNRNAMLELTDEQLKDIGLSRSQAYSDYSGQRLGASNALERRCL